MSSVQPVACVICAGESGPAGVKDTFEFFRCRSCGHFFLWPMPGPAETAAIYTQDYFSGANRGFGYVDYDRDKQPMVPAFEKYLDLMAGLGARGGRLLDVGAATGFFLDIARKRGWDVHGVEVSDDAAEMGRRKGIPVITGTLEQVAHPARSFEVITMWDVIEHMTEPQDAVRKAHALLQPGGLLAINTPDSGSLLAKTLGVKWHLVVPPEHLNLFHRRSLRYLLEQQGFEIVIESTIGKKFTLQYVFQTLSHWQKLRIWERLSERLRDHAVNRIGIPINLRDNMFVVARKRAGSNGQSSTSNRK